MVTSNAPSLGSNHQPHITGQEPELSSVQFVRQLIDSYEQLTPRQKLRAYQRLDRIEDADVVPVVASALTSLSGHVMILKFISLLARLRDQRAVPALIEVLKGRDSFFSQEAAGALGEIGSITAVPALREALTYDSWVSNAAGSALIMIALNNVDLRQIKPYLIELLQGDRDILAGLAAIALGEIGDVCAVPYLILAVEDDNYFVRACAVQALGAIGSSSAIPTLENALYDSHNMGRLTPLERLLYGFPHLTKHLENDEFEQLKALNVSRVCDIATQSLERIGTPEALAVIETWRSKHGNK